MADPEHKNNPEFLKYVYELSDGIELTKGFQLSLEVIDNIDIAQLKRFGLKTYAKDKWTIHKIFQHLIDWERIWCFRAILFARQEGSVPEAHDQEIMAENSNADERSIEDLIDELRIVRQSSIALFNSFDPKILDTICEFFEYQMTINDIGLTITAHQIHHLNVIKERYLTLDK